LSHLFVNKANKVNNPGAIVENKLMGVAG